MKNSTRPNSSATPSIKAVAQPKGILVLGMHRSGTSALTRVLNLLGCALTDNLLGAGVGNETGHWEAASAVTLNDQIFASAGTRWDDWGPLNDDWRQSPLRDEMLHKAAAVIEEHADLGSLFAIKDPRLCRLADVWLAAMEEAKVEPSAVLMLRNPAEVIASLESRDLMAPEYGQLLWLRHALDAEFFSRGSKRVFCRYDQLLSNWFSVIDRVRIGLGVTLPRNSPSVHLEIEQYLNDKHRHHQVPIEAVIGNPALSDWLRRTFAIMMNWSEEGEKSSDYAELDQTRLEFDRSYSTFARLLMPGGLTGGAGLGPSMKRELTEAQQAMQDAEIASQETEARLSSAAAREAEITAEKAREHELRNAELLGRLAEAESAMIQRQEELAQLMAQFLEAERASAHAVVKEAIAQEQLLEAKQRIVEATDQIEAMAQRSAAERQAAEVKTDRLQTEIIQMTQILQAQQEETRFLKITRELVERALAEQKEAANEMNIKFEQQQAAMGLAEQKIRDRFTEIARLTAILADEGVKIDQATFNQEWLRSALQLAARFPKWWLLMPPKWRRKREHARYRYHGLFDAEKYLSMYPDVAEDGMDPIRHYILHGMGEGRSMTIE